MIDSEYLIIKWDWLENSLDDVELDKLYEFINRASFDKDEDRIFVIQKVPYQNEALDNINKKSVKLEKEKLLNKLNELSKLEDSEIACIEATEALLDYINDDDITDAYSDIPLYFQ